MIDLSGVPELHVLETSADGSLRVGAAVSARQLELAPAVLSDFRALADSAAVVGSVQVRNLATLGGNLCNAAPSADMAPPVMVLDAEAVITGPNGQRAPIAEFSGACGGRSSAQVSCWSKSSSRRPAAAAPTSATRPAASWTSRSSASLTLDGDRCTKARVALAAVAPTPVHATAAEQALEGDGHPELIERAAELAIGAARPISDQRGSADAAATWSMSSPAPSPPPWTEPGPLNPERERGAGGQPECGWPRSSLTLGVSRGAQVHYAQGVRSRWRR